MDQKNKLSVVIITYNEEKNIAKCLESIKNIADEIVVVDSFSKDNTKQICHQYGVAFYENSFKGHIEQKNFALSKANYKFVLSLDADESVDEDLKKEILHLKNNNKLGNFKMKRKTFYCNVWIRGCGWYPDIKVRLFNTEEAFWGGTNPHDTIQFKDKHTQAILLKGNILHYSYHSIEDHKIKTMKYAEIMANAEFKMGKKRNVFHLFFKPLWKFFYCYFLRLGILDGRYGFIVCRITSLGIYKKIKLHLELQKQKMFYSRS